MSPPLPSSPTEWTARLAPLLAFGASLALVGATALLWARHGADVFGAIVVSMLQACF